MTGSPLPRIRLATEADLPAINAIYNREILEGVATWDTEPWSAEQRRAWLIEHTRPGAVAIVADLPGDPVVGFGYLSFYKTRLGYRFTREDTLYVRPEHHRRGVGRALLGALLAEARRLEVHAVLARIEATNAPSIELHRALGFAVTGEERETGHKFGQWRSLVQMQIVLPGDDDGDGERGDGALPEASPRLVPELVVSDITRSLAFYRDILGFVVRYERPEERFAFLDRAGACLMLEQPTGRSFLAGELARPYGRGANFQIEVSDVDALYDRVRAARATLHLPIEEHWYRRERRLLGSRQFVVEDPDGYLLRFFEDLGERPA